MKGISLQNISFAKGIARHAILPCKGRNNMPTRTSYFEPVRGIALISIKPSKGIVRESTSYAKGVNRELYVNAEDVFLIEGYPPQLKYGGY
ncbi:MAG: hypothetical protein ABFD50_21830 [Smithella sp.]